MMNSILKIFKILSEKEKKGLLIISILLLLGMFFEIFGLGLIFPFIISILDTDSIEKIFFLNKVYIFFGFQKNDFTILLLSLIVIVFLFKTIFMIYLTVKQNRFVNQLNYNLSNKLFSIYLNKSLDYHNKINSSQLIKNIQIEIAYFRSFCMSLITLGIELSLVISIFFTLILIETNGAFLIGVYFLSISIIYYQFLKPYIIKYGKQREKLVKILSKTLIEGITSIRELILFQAIDTYENNFNINNEKLVEINTKNGTYQQLPRLLLELFAIIGIVIFIFFLIINGKEKTIIISTIGIFIAATFRLLPSLNRILGAIQNMKFYSPSINLIHDEIFIDASNNNNNNLQDIEQIEFKSKIQIKDLFFKYLKNDSKWNLEDINFTIKKGDIIGIMGSSGSGKSTLIDLIVGFYSPDKGQFLIDGISKNLNNKSWRKQIGYVSQNIILIDDTILKNITLGKNLNELNLDKVNYVIEKAGLNEFIKNLENGFNTIVGEKGVKISGGQRQRIGIARALYQNPKILLLDEATSALDNNTEEMILDSLEKLKGELTIIIAAHRISTLRNCDLVYKIENHKLKIHDLCL